MMWFNLVLFIAFLDFSIGVSNFKVGLDSSSHISFQNGFKSALNRINNDGGIAGSDIEVEMLHSSSFSDDVDNLIANDPYNLNIAVGGSKNDNINIIKDKNGIVLSPVLSGKIPFRTSFDDNFIFLIPSNMDQYAAILDHYSDFSIHNFAAIVDIAGGCTSELVSSAIAKLGTTLQFAVTIDTSSSISDVYSSMLDNLKALPVDVFIICGTPDSATWFGEFIQKLLENKEEFGAEVIRFGAITDLREGLLDKVASLKGIYGSTFDFVVGASFPSVTDTSVQLIQSYTTDLTSYDTSSVPTDIGVSGYLTGLLIEKALLSGVRDSASWLEFIYDGTHRLDGYLIGPFLNTCEGLPSTASCPCNQGSHVAYIDVMSNSGALERDETPFSWATCGIHHAERETIFLGQVAVFSGPTSMLGYCMNLGIEAALMEYNANSNRMYDIELKTLDDGYEPDESIIAMQTMLDDSEIFAMIGMVGTPTSLVTAPMCVDAGMPFIGAFTGAEFLRRPFSKYVINVRASYLDETAAMIDYLVDVKGLRRISIMYQDDSFGSGGYTGILSALVERSMWLESEGIYTRNTDNIMPGYINIFAGKNNPDAIVFIGTASPLNEFVRTVRTAGWDGIIMVVSFAGGETVAELLDEERFRENIMMTQVVPPPTDSTNAFALRHKAAIKAYNSTAEGSFCSLEGYSAAVMTFEALERIEGRLTRENFLNTVYAPSLFDLDGIVLGPYQDINESCTVDDCHCNQGMHSVFISTLNPEDGSLSLNEDKPQFSFTTCGFHSPYVAPECDDSYWKFLVDGCDSGGDREVTFEWKLPFPGNEAIAWDCSEGLNLPNSTSVSCEYLVLDSDFGLNLIVTTILAIALIIVTMMVVNFYKRKKVMSNGQPVFMHVGLLGSLIMCFAPFFYLGKPHNYSCIGGISTLSLGFSITQCAVFVKTWRIYKIFSNSKLKKHKMSTRRLLRRMVYLVGNDVLFIVLWIISESPGVETNSESYDGFTVDEISCSYGNRLFYMIAFIKIVLIALPCYFSWKIRKVPDKFNEGKNIFLSSYTTLLITVVCISLISSMDLDAIPRNMIITIGIILGALCPHLLIISPKIIRICRGSAINPSSTKSSTNLTENHFKDMSSSTLFSALTRAHKKIKELQNLVNVRDHTRSRISLSTEGSILPSTGNGCAETHDSISDAAMKMGVDGGRNTILGNHRTVMLQTNNSKDSDEDNNHGSSGSADDEGIDGSNKAIEGRNGSGIAWLTPKLAPHVVIAKRPSLTPPVEFATAAMSNGSVRVLSSGGPRNSMTCLKAKPLSQKYVLR